MGEAQGLWEPQRRHLVQMEAGEGFLLEKTSELSLEGVCVSQVERGEDKGKASSAEGTAHRKVGGDCKSVMLPVNPKSSLPGARM